MPLKKSYIALGLGVVSAIVFISSMTGTILFRYLFFLLTSLPIFLSGLGWGWRSASLSGLSCFILLTFLVGYEPALLCAAGQIVPAIVLCYLALLSRPRMHEDQVKETLEWYPPGRLLLWASLMAGSFSFILFLLSDRDLESLKSNFKEYISKSINASLYSSGELQSLIDEEQITTLTDLAITLVPAGTSVSWLCALLFNLWLAGRITLASGQLQRPWPHLSELEYPPGTALMLVASMLAANASGKVSLVGIAFLGSFFILYVLSGLSVLHHITQATSWRPFILWILYISLFLINFWVALCVAIIGLLEGPLKFRQRISSTGKDPPSSKIHKI